MRIITGKARGLKLTVPKNMDVRPTADRVKESLFNIIGTKIIGARVLDMFAGTGNLGLESWSRGAAAVTFVDKAMFTMEERVEMLRDATKHIPNARVTCFSGLLNEFCRQEKAPFIVRGLRAFSDFEYEFQRALLIKKIDNNLETVFIMTNANYSFLSSSGIRELATFGGCIHGLVPECVEDRIKSLVISKE